MNQNFFAAAAGLPPLAAPDLVFAFAYGRVSSKGGSGRNERSRQEESLEIQDKTVHDYIAGAGIPESAFGDNFERIYLERHTGAFDFGDLRTRPKGALLWAALEKVRHDHPTAKIHLIISKPDRFTRNRLDGEIALRDLRRLGVRVHFVSLGGQSFDADSPAGQLIVSILLWAAEHEVSSIKGRILDNKASWREKNYFLGGSHAPYGRDLQPALDPEGRQLRSDRDKPLFHLVQNVTEEKWLRHMWALRCGGCGYHTIAKRLNAQGVPTKTGGRWNCGQIYNLVGTHADGTIINLTARQILACLPEPAD